MPPSFVTFDQIAECLHVDRPIVEHGADLPVRELRYVAVAD